MGDLFCCMCATKCIKSMIGGRIREKCPNCGFVYFKNPVPGVSVALLDGAKIALGKRVDSGKWCLPCGCVEYGESYLEAAVREVKEEIGIDSEPLKIISVNSNNLQSIYSVAVVIVSKPLSYELLAGVDEEMTDAGWFDVNGPLPELEFEADRYIIEKIKESLASQTELSGIPLSERQTFFT